MNELHQCKTCNEVFSITTSGLFNRSLSNSTYVCVDPTKEAATCPCCDNSWVPEWAVGLDEMDGEVV